MYKIIILMLIVAVFSTACSLDRKNPLDPSGNASIVAPDKVLGITFSKVTSPQNLIILRWDEMPEATGYYIHRAFSLTAGKEIIETIEHNVITEYTDSHGIVQGNRYYYWISAFIEYPEGRLEGKLSDYVEVRF